MIQNIELESLENVQIAKSEVLARYENHQN